MAKKSNKVKEVEVVLEGGVLYERQIFLIQSRMFSLTHTDTIRYRNKLDTLSFIKDDDNDKNGITKLFFIHTEIEDVVTDNI